MASGLWKVYFGLGLLTGVLCVALMEENNSAGVSIGMGVFGGLCMVASAIAAGRPAPPRPPRDL